MTVQSVFADARDRWHRRYLHALASYKEQYRPSAPEVMFELSDNGQPRVFRLYRADMASGATNPPNMADVNLEPVADTGSKEFSLPSGLVVQLRPIHWNGVEFLVDEIPDDGEQLQKWCSKWLDLDEVGPADEHGLLGVIHHVTAPEPQGNGIMFSVDFGSAPIGAVDELFALLHRGGASLVRVSSSWGYEA